MFSDLKDTFLNSDILFGGDLPRSPKPCAVGGDAALKTGVAVVQSYTQSTDGAEGVRPPENDKEEPD